MQKVRGKRQRLIAGNTCPFNVAYDMPTYAYPNFLTFTPHCGYFITSGSAGRVLAGWVDGCYVWRAENNKHFAALCTRAERERKRDRAREEERRDDRSFASSSSWFVPLRLDCKCEGRFTVAPPGVCYLRPLKTQDRRC